MAGVWDSRRKSNLKVRRACTICGCTRLHKERPIPASCGPQRKGTLGAFWDKFILRAHLQKATRGLRRVATFLPIVRRHCWVASHKCHGECRKWKTWMSQSVVRKCAGTWGFTRPEPFLQLFKPLAKTKDGFLDRVLMCSIKPHLLHEEEVENWCEKLEGYVTRGFTGNYHDLSLF